MNNAADSPTAENHENKDETDSIWTNQQKWSDTALCFWSGHATWRRAVLMDSVVFPHSSFITETGAHDSFALLRGAGPEPAAADTTTDWRYLLAAVMCFFFPPGPLQHKAAPLHTTTHPHELPPPPSLRPPGLSTCANTGPTLPPPPTSVSFWYLYFHRILMTLCFSFHVSLLLLCSIIAMCRVFLTYVSLSKPLAC